MNGEGLPTAASAYLVKLAAAHRKAGNIVSSAEVIEAVRLADALRQLRGSKYPCLQEDLYRQLKKLRLERFRIAELQQLDLDLREKLNAKSEETALLDLRRSFFLHRLRVLGVHFAKPLRSKQDNANWGEYWELRWTPEVEIEVVESALLGDTIEGAAAFALKERGDRANTIAEADAIFQDAFLCGMPAAAAHALTVLQAMSVDAAALTDVADTAQRLSLVVRYGDLRRFDAAPVVPLLQQLYLRACLTLEDACICDAKAAPAVTAAMDSPCFACTPELLPELLERTLKGQDLSVFQKRSSLFARRQTS